MLTLAGVLARRLGVADSAWLDKRGLFFLHLSLVDSRARRFECTVARDPDTQAKVEVGSSSLSLHILRV